MTEILVGILIALVVPWVLVLLCVYVRWVLEWTGRYFPGFWD